MQAPTSPAPRRSLPLGAAVRHLFTAAAVAGLLGFGSLPVQAGRQLAPGQTFDLQLTRPFNLVRPVSSIALDLFTTPPEQLNELRARGVATFCYIAAGFWESWRPDAWTFPAIALGSSVSGWPGQRWLDLGSPVLEPILEARLDLCHERGFDGVLLAGLDSPDDGSGFATKAEQRFALQRGLAAAARARDLAVGVIGDIARAAQLADVFDFLVAYGCPGSDGCAAALEPWRAAGKPAYLVAYTNQASKMDRLCGEAAELGTQLIFKTQSLNGKLHRRCS